MALHPVRVIRVQEIKPHTGADKLEIISIPGTMWQSVQPIGTYKVGDLAVFVEPDMVVPTNQPDFAWLAKEGKETHRVKAVRLRGQLSFGLLIPAPSIYALDKGDGTPGPFKRVEEGEDLAQVYGITRYEPPIQVAGADGLKGLWPAGYPKMEVEALANHPGILRVGENVIVTEKVHGTSARYLFNDGVFYMGSRTRWLDPTAGHAWAIADKRSKMPPLEGEGNEQILWGIEQWCRMHEGTCLYGEVYGPVQTLKYDEKTPTFRCFGAWKPDEGWHMPRDLRQYNVMTVPLVFIGPWDPNFVLPMAETNSEIPTVFGKKHMMEGIVITALPERYDPSFGRVCLKYISQRYWTSAH